VDFLASTAIVLVGAFLFFVFVPVGFFGALAKSPGGRFRRRARRRRRSARGPLASLDAPPRGRGCGHRVAARHAHQPAQQEELGL